MPQAMQKSWVGLWSLVLWCEFTAYDYDEVYALEGLQVPWQSRESLCPCFFFSFFSFIVHEH
jgi:hypothetical protein